MYVFSEAKHIHMLPHSAFLKSEVTNRGFLHIYAYLVLSLSFVVSLFVG